MTQSGHPIHRNCAPPALSPCQSALKGTHGRGSRMNQSWGRDVWGSGTVVVTHNRYVSVAHGDDRFPRRRRRWQTRNAAVSSAANWRRPAEEEDATPRRRLRRRGYTTARFCVLVLVHHSLLHHHLLSLRGSVRKRRSDSGSELLPLCICVDMYVCVYLLNK